MAISAREDGERETVLVDEDDDISSKAAFTRGNKDISVKYLAWGDVVVLPLALLLVMAALMEAEREVEVERVEEGDDDGREEEEEEEELEAE